MTKKFDPPEQLRNLQGWIIWKSEHHEGEKKPRKVPYYVNGVRRHGVNGSKEDRDMLSTYDEAVKAATTFEAAGVGLALMQDFGITALDFDNCIDAEGNIDPIVEELTVETYSEISPSGKGVRAFVIGDLGNYKSPTTPDQFGFELFSSKGFVTFTGNVTELSRMTGNYRTLCEPSSELVDFIQTRFIDKRQKDSKPSQPSSIEPLGVDMAVLSEGLRSLPGDLDYDAWLHVGMAIHHEFSGSEEGFVLWDTWSAESPKYSTEEYSRTKWNSFGKNPDNPITIRSLLRLINYYGGTVSELTDADFPEIVEEKVQRVNRFNIRTAEEMVSMSSSVNWLIKDLLPKATLGVLYGESGSGKSFVALDLCASLARGLDWNGLRCKAKAHRVLYVVAEGGGGFAKRITAYCLEKGISTRDLGIDIIHDISPNLMNKDDVSQLIFEIKAQPKYDLIVMDTFAQVTPGANENSAEDMGAALAACRVISSTSGAMVLLVHHSGKDSTKGVRGWSGLHAAADVVLGIKVVEGGRNISVIKQKDGAIGSEFGFELKPVVLGEDEDGEDIVSCAVHYCEPTKPSRKMRENQKLIYDVMVEYSPGAWVTEKQIIDGCMSLFEPGEAKPRRDNLSRALETMVDVFLETNSKKEYRILLK